MLRKFKEEIHSSEIGLHKYEIFRADRHIPGVDLGGGVLIAVHKSIKSKLITAISDHFECLFVEIKIRNNIFIISALYVPPDSNVSLYQKYLLSLENIRNRYNNAQFIDPK
uniref:Uncharacterized protein n=1 Tax=Cacopsylla melanoneura TaxID=428564 RepID=A0A8D8VZL4_9HEMI